MKRRLAGGLAVAVLLCLSAAAQAQSAGDWTLAIGAHQVDPKSDNGSVVDGALDVRVDADAKPTLMLEYFIRDGLGIEVIAAAPFKHDIALVGIGKVAETKQLPPTVSLQYHFNHAGKASPFVGAGLNYTLFFSEKTTGALAGTKLELDPSVGLGLHAGIDFKVGEKGAIRIDARWIDIDTEVKLEGEKIGTVNIDPMAYGIAYVVKF